MTRPTTRGALLGQDDAFAKRLIQVIYRSRCLTDEGGEREILEQSRRNNPLQEITGVLVAHGGWFVQVLEGPASAVSQLLTRIEGDRRNGEFLLLRATPIETRDFGDWSMASTVVDADRFLQILDGLVAGTTETKQMLSGFILRGDWPESQLP